MENGCAQMQERAKKSKIEILEETSWEKQIEFNKQIENTQLDFQILHNLCPEIKRMGN